MCAVRSSPPLPGDFLRLAVARAAAGAAMPAVLRRVLPEVPQDKRPQAAGLRAVIHHSVQAVHVLIAHCRLLRRRHVLVWLGVLNHPLRGENVRPVVQQDALRCLAVASGAPCLLIVRLHRARHLVVDDKPHVGFVDAHAERVRRDHHRAGVVLKFFLILLALLVAQPRVIARRVDARANQLVADLLDRFARRAVDDAAFAAFPAENIHEGSITVLWADDLEVEVRAVEAGRDRFRVLQAQ